MTDESTSGPPKAEPTIESERAKYAEVWQSAPYRKACHGLDLWREHRDIFPPNPRSVIDIGCGTGRLFGHLRDNGIAAHAIDLVDGLDPDIRERHAAYFTTTAIQDMRYFLAHWELGICCDVMEHLPESQVHAALDAIRDATDTSVFMIANHESTHLGHELHLTQRPPEWWQAQMKAVFGTVERLPYVRRRWRDPDVVFLFRCS
jgi:SAM-dependent methyltransferase